jgi:hypothetical protein
VEYEGKAARMTRSNSDCVTSVVSIQKSRVKPTACTGCSSALPVAEPIWKELPFAFTNTMAPLCAGPVGSGSVPLSSESQETKTSIAAQAIAARRNTARRRKLGSMGELRIYASEKGFSGTTGCHTGTTNRVV